MFATEIIKWNKFRENRFLSICGEYLCELEVLNSTFQCYLIKETNTLTAHFISDYGREKSCYIKAHFHFSSKWYYTEGAENFTEISFSSLILSVIVSRIR